MISFHVTPLNPQQLRRRIINGVLLVICVELFAYSLLSFIALAFWLF
jgi:hypothetical protein